MMGSERVMNYFEENAQHMEHLCCGHGGTFDCLLDPIISKTLDSTLNLVSLALEKRLT